MKFIVLLQVCTKQGEELCLYHVLVYDFIF